MQEPLNDTECCKNLKFHNFLSIKKFISNTYMHHWQGWTCSWPKYPMKMGRQQIPLLLFPPYFRSFTVSEKGSLHEVYIIHIWHRGKKLLTTAHQNKFKVLIYFAKHMCSVTKKYGTYIHIYIHRHIHTHFNTWKHIKPKIKELFPTSNTLQSQKRTRISDLNCGIFLFWVCHTDKYYIQTYDPSGCNFSFSS
jgi:hypothetical protein